MASESTSGTVTPSGAGKAVGGGLARQSVLAAAIGVGASWLKFVSPLPYPISQAGLAVGIWFAVGLVYLVYLAARHPGRVRDMEEVFG